MPNINEIIKGNIYVKFLTDEFHIGINPHIIGYEKCHQDKGVISFKKGVYVLHFILHGKGEAVIDGKKYSLSKNMGFLYSPNQKIYYSPDKNDPWEYIWLEFNGVSSELILRNASINKYQPVISYLDNMFISTKLQEMIIACSSTKNYSSLYITTIILQILESLVYHKKRSTQKKLSKKEKEVNKVIKYIEANYTDPTISIKEISNMFYINSSYLSRIFKQVTGLSPIQFIISLKMKKAKEMLSLDIYTIKEISDTIGFNNQFYFSRKFRENFGLSPTNYKKMEIQDN